MAIARTFRLNDGTSVDRLGFGAMRLCGQPGNFGPYADWDAGKALLRQAVELGTNFIDTAHAYGPGYNEDLIADALHPYADGLVVATKGGVEKYGPTDIRVEGSPEALRRHVDESRRRLKVDRLDLFQLHRPDPSVGWELQIETLVRLQAEGKMGMIGLSNVSLDHLERAVAIAPIATVQNRYNARERADDALVEFSAERGIAFLTYAPLGADPFRRGAPLAEGAAEGRGSPAQQALAWLLARAANIIVIPGTTTPAHLVENRGAWSLAN